MSNVKKLYYNPKFSGSFSGAQTFANERKVSKVEATNELNKLKEYYLYRPAKKSFKRRPIVVHFPFFQIAFDLMDLQKYKQENNGCRYILVVIDCFSRFLYAEPLKNKTAEQVIIAFRKIFKRMKEMPKYATADAGKEWMNWKFSEFMKEKNIHFFNTYSHIKASMAERVIRTLKSRMERYFEKTGRHKYIDILQKLVTSYNKTKHSSTKFRPVDISHENEQQVWSNLYAKYLNKPVKLKFNVGDIVRISRYKLEFEKGYTANWTKETFKIVKTQKAGPFYVYHLNDLDGEEIIGSFYAEELQKA